MAINANKPERWKEDIAASVDQFNKWFLKFAPQAYRESRIKTTASVEQALLRSDDLKNLTPDTLKRNPSILPSLRMACCPPLARERLVGLAGVRLTLVKTLEEDTVPRRINAAALDDGLARIVAILAQMLDIDIFPWLAAQKSPSEADRHRASTIVADRLCGAVSDPIIRNAQEKRQFELIQTYLKAKGYKRKVHPPDQPLNAMEPGTYSFRMIVIVGEGPQKVNLPIDVVIQPKKPPPSGLPILMEAKSAGDFTNVNKRRKEEAKKMQQLRAKFGNEVQFILFLCGYFNAGYLGYEAADGMDWIWEHRVSDIDQLGL